MQVHKENQNKHTNTLIRSSQGVSSGDLGRHSAVPHD